MTQFTSSFIPKCWFCKHFDAEAHEKFIASRCTAFPNRIPDEIWYNNHDHTQPYPNDNGIRFEKLDVEALQHRRAFRRNTPEEIERKLNGTPYNDEFGADQE